MPELFAHRPSRACVHLEVGARVHQDVEPRLGPSGGPLGSFLAADTIAKLGPPCCRRLSPWLRPVPLATFGNVLRSPGMQTLGLTWVYVASYRFGVVSCGWQTQSVVPGVCDLFIPNSLTEAFRRSTSQQRMDSNRKLTETSSWAHSTCGAFSSLIVERGWSEH